jgi:hypothetical protein
MSFCSRKPTPNPMSGEITKADEDLGHAVDLAVAEFREAPLDVARPGGEDDGRPTSPPTRACEDEDGIPNHQVPRFHVMAPTMPQSTMIMAVFCGKVPTSMNLPMVLATAVPPRMGPRNSKVATMMTACTGVMAALRLSA